MNINLLGNNDICRLIFEGELTFENALDLEDGILDALRRYTQFEVDLSAVREIDLCGLHLLRILETVGGYRVEIVAGSPIVERAQRRFLSSQRATCLRGTREERSALANSP